MNPVEVEKVVAPAAIERALAVYRQMRQQDHSVLVQARKILTQHIYGMVDRGEHDEQRLTVGGLVYLKAVERDHKIKSAQDASVRRPKGTRNSFDFAVLEATADNDCQLRANVEPEMCDKCIELDGKIEHYERVAASIPDQLTIDRIKELVEQTKAQKAALHPQQE